MLTFYGKHLRAHLIGTTAISALCATAAQAQPVSDNSIEQVVVSGSRITIAGYSQPTPVTVVGTAQLEKEAYANIADSVRSLPQVQAPPSSYGTTQATASGGSVGTNLLNLRDLGASRTLVLFDSQRVVQSTRAGGVDVTTFPSTLVSRVDVVTGGASAAWGSDAVAGVVNFVLNKNFTGFKATVQAATTTVGPFRGLSFDTAWGDDVFGGRGHVEFAGSASFKPDGVLLKEANWFRGAYWVSNPAYVPGSGRPQLIVANNVGLASSTNGGIINSSPAGVAGPGVTAAPANALRGIEFVGSGIPQRVDYGNITLGTLSNGGSLTARNSAQAYATIANPANTYSLFGYGRYALTDNIQASLQLNYGYFTGVGQSGGLTQTALVIKSDNAFIPASVRATMQAGGITSFTMGTYNSNNYNTYTATDENHYKQAAGALAPGTYYTRRNLLRWVFTLSGTLGDDWSWTAYFQRSAVRYSSHILGAPIVANLTAAQDAVSVTAANRGTSGLPLGSIVCRSSLTGAAVVVGAMTAQPGCIPLDVFGEGVASPAAIAYINGFSTNSANYAHQTLQQEVAEASMQGTLPWEMPAGKVAFAFGAGYRKESAVADTNAIDVALGYAQGNFAVFPFRSYTVFEGFAELDVPILKNSIVNSLDMSMAGRITDYSTSGLVETWKLGATAQVNDDIKLRATWSVDIRAPQLDDLYAQGGASIANRRDPKTQLTVTTTSITPGNPNLVPEVGRTISGGVVLTPTFIPGLSLSADWYAINLTGKIASLNVDLLLAACNATQPSPFNPGQNGNPNDPICSRLTFAGPNGALSSINNSVLNFASHTTSGLDIQANYVHDFWEGSLAWSALANLNDQNTITQPGAGRNDFAGANDLGSSAAGPTAPGPKWRGVLAADYTTGPYSVTVQSRWFGSSLTNRNGNSGNLATPTTRDLYDPAHFHVPVIAYLDLRGSYKWNPNITLYGAIDNALNTPPGLVPVLSSITGIGGGMVYHTNTATYDMLGRSFRMGVRFNY